MEVVGLRKKGEKTDAFVKFKDSSVVLDKILDFQRSPFDKSGLGYKKEGEKNEDDTWSPKTPEAGPSSSKYAPHAPAHDNKDFGSSRMHQGFRPIPQSKLRKETNPIWNQSPRYKNGFNGYCFSCSNFGHKAMDCRLHGRRSVGSPNDKVRCYTCNHVGNIVAYYRTMRYYSRSCFGHKDQDCCSTRKQPMSRISYNSSRKASTDEGTNTKRTKAKKQVWMKKTEQLQIGEVDQSREDGCHLESQV